jgi:hypothetical protein
MDDRESTIYVALAGACDPAAVAIRRAQAAVRLDRRPGYFSKVLVFTGRGEEVIHVPLIGADPRRPESLGIVRGASDSFGAVAAYPNLAVLSVTLDANADRRMAAFREAVARPERLARARDLWGLIARWQPYLFEPERVPNPLLEGISHPGTVLARWLLAAAGIEATPGATEEGDAPEHLWALARWWTQAMKDDAVAATVRHYRRIEDPGCAVAPAG